jgi:hypothetical protein
MQAIMEKIDDVYVAEVAAQKQPALNNDEESYTLDLPVEVQISMGKIIDFYKDHAMKPLFQLKGNPLEITSEFCRKLKETVPDHMQVDAKTVLNFMVGHIVEFCRGQHARALTLNFSFERGRGSL